MTLNQLNERIQVYSSRISKSNQSKLEALVEIKKEFIKKSNEPKISETALLSEVARDLKNKYSQLFSMHKSNVYLTKLGVCKAFEGKLLPIPEIKKLVSNVSKPTKENVKKYFQAISSKDYISYKDFEKAYSQLFSKD